MFKDPTKIVILVFGILGIVLMYYGGISIMSIIGILLAYTAWHLEFKIRETNEKKEKNEDEL